MDDVKGVLTLNVVDSNLPIEPVEVTEPLTLPLAIKSSINKSPLAVKLPVTFIESLKSIASPPLTDSKASALTTPLAVILPCTIRC